MAGSRNNDLHPVFRSRLSFRPLIREWEKTIQKKPSGAGKVYQSIIDEVSHYPELMEPIDSFNKLQLYHDVIEQMMTTVCPLTGTVNNYMFSIFAPFSNKIVFASESYKKFFVDEPQYTQLRDQRKEKILVDEKITLAYKVILEKFYQFQLTGEITTVYPFRNSEDGLDKYLESELNARFIDVFTELELPPLPASIRNNCRLTRDLLQYPELMELLPLDQFEFEGIVIVYTRQATVKKTLSIIKKALAKSNPFSNDDTFDILQQETRNLLAMRGLVIGLTPFFKINKHFVYSELHHSRSIVMKDIHETSEKIKLSKHIQKLFNKGSIDFLLILELNEQSTKEYGFLLPLLNKGYKSAFIFPFRKNDEVFGILEIVSERTFSLESIDIAKANIDPLIDILQSTLERSWEFIESQVNKVVKEQFTAVQPSVEWKFTDAAFNYLSRLNKGEDAKMEQIIFKQVYPLYGSIDIRNSSVERNLAIQQDFIEQLTNIKSIVIKSQLFIDLPLFKELESRIDSYIHSLTDLLIGDDEQLIQLFLRSEATELLLYIKETIPDLENEVEQYFGMIDEALQIFSHHRKEFEETVTQINSHIVRFLDREQAEAQHIFPHYFERFVTDGVDFNIYIGKSICPDKKFNLVYLKSLKLWQLTTLARAAQRSHRLSKSLPLSLQTAQLILVHNEPISISFRTAERKFDVDGVYNVRYEVLKKRIDKVRIKNTNERLTQPGTIAVVFSQTKDAEEYLKYFDFLKKQNLLAGEVKQYDLEELQGISGLKAFRVTVMIEEPEKAEKKQNQIQIKS